MPLHDTDGGRQRQPLPCPVEGRLQGLQRGLGEVGELFGAGGVLDEQGEFVAAEPGHQVGAGAAVPGLVGDPGQPLGDGGEQPVADPVSEGVVDGLEAVQVQVAQADPAGAAQLVRLRLQGARQTLEEQGAVGQPGHRVVHLQVPQPGLEFAAGADVGDRHEDAGPGVRERGHGDLHPHRVPLGMFQSAGAAQPGLPAAQDLAVGVPGAGVRGQVHQIRGDPSGQAVRVGAEQLAEGCVGADDQAFAIDDSHGERGGREDTVIGVVITVCDG